MGVLQKLENLILSVEKLNTDGVPSASLAILEDGNISSHVITNGKEDIETVYQACSISKPITALAVAKLVDEGRLSHETKVVNHLTKTVIDCLVDEKTAHLLQHVTVGMLLSHTSGLSQHGFPGYADDMPSPEAVLSGRYPSKTPKVHFLSFPGQQFDYSGGGYTVLQLFLEGLMKMSFPDLMQRLVLQPLGMTRSWFGAFPKGETNFANAHYTAYTEASHRKFPELAAAGLWTTPTDLLKAASAVQESLYTDKGFISQDTARKMLTQNAEKPSSAGIAFGWDVDDKAFAHAGSNDPGYECYMVGFHGGSVDSCAPVTGSKPRNGIAIMMNSSLGGWVIEPITGAILYLENWKGFSRLPGLFGEGNEFVPYAAPEDTKLGEGWQEWIGKWAEDWEIVDDDGPAVVFQSFPPMRLKPAAVVADELEGEKQEFVFVVDGLQFGLRLTWMKEEQVIISLQDRSKTLKR
jgi:CubicO group peptidase (beta-lactamase class C family)